MTSNTKARAQHKISLQAELSWCVFVLPNFHMFSAHPSYGRNRTESPKSVGQNFTLGEERKKTEEARFFPANISELWNLSCQDGI